MQPKCVAHCWCSSVLAKRMLCPSRLESLHDMLLFDARTSMRFISMGCDYLPMCWTKLFSGTQPHQHQSNGAKAFDLEVVRVCRLHAAQW